MTETYLELTEDEFDNQYPLVENHLNPSAGWAIGDAPWSTLFGHWRNWHLSGSRISVASGPSLMAMAALP